ncbi:hypothetical protein Cni_G14029 [Canna indica]|uniref:Endonuclease/exonuclease/phosphatase domain-containing protein n=1 Tax=Canna indica TaxID=4628 RepID=A0AAQ3QAB0_9LILI|nr:hypothetical protein Cni_G14029 [Canna indica]
MIILNWNCRGAFKRSVKDRLHAFIRFSRVQALCLQETRLLLPQASKLIHSFGRHWNGVAAPSNRASGGIILAWDSTSINTKVLSIEPHVIHAIIGCHSCTPFLLSTL